MTSTAHLVHGFNVTDAGAATTDKLAPYLEGAGLRVQQHDYGWFGLIRVRLCNGIVANLIKGYTRPGDIGVGHSNGCAILAEAADRGAPFSGLVLINPALDSDRSIAPQVRWVHVYHNSKDVAVWLSRLLVFSHPWGAMGRIGYDGPADERYTNINCDDSVAGHSDIFTKLDGEPAWGSKIASRVAFARSRPHYRLAPYPERINA